jgi:hypothetical protein
MDSIDTELKDIQARLSRLYEVLETGKFGLEELTPRIKELRTRQDELSSTRLQLEAEAITRGVSEVNLLTVKTYAEDLRNILEEADFGEKKVFLRSFIKRIDISGTKVKIAYKLPQRESGNPEEIEEVLPIDIFGGAKCTEQRTFTLAFSLAT